MRSGLLRKRITLQRSTSTQDGFGQDVITWGDVGSRWASVEPLAGREFEDGQQNISRVETRFVTRYTTGITSKNRIVFDNVNYEIESIINVDQRNREMEILCSRITTA